MRSNSITILIFVISLICFVSWVLAQTSTQWNIMYDLHGSGWCVIKTKDGGYALAGNSDNQFLLLKVNSSGAVQWKKTYGEGTAYSIIETNDGGYALAGTGDNINFVKTDSEGNLEWSKHYHKMDAPFHTQSLIQTKDGGYALTGWISSIFSSPSWDWTIKTDSNGNILWNKTFGLRSGISSGHEILQEDDGRYILAANGNITKLDSEGNMQWTKPCTVANAMIRAEDGGYLAVSGTGAALVKTDSDGNIEWHQTYRFQGARWSFFNSVSQSSFGGYVVAGVTYPVYDGLAWIVKVDEYGNVGGEVTFPPETGINNNAHCIIESSDGDYVFTGSKNANNGEGNVWLAKIALSAIPEFPSWTPMLIMLVAVVVVVVVYRHNLNKHTGRAEK